MLLAVPVNSQIRLKNGRHISSISLINHKEVSMNTTIRWFTLALVIGLVWQPGRAGTVIGTTGTKCYPTNYSNAATISVYGDWIENIDRATTNATGVTITILEKLNGLQNNSGQFAGKGKVTLKIKTNNASPGNKTITLTDDPGPLNPGNTFTITITIVGTVTVTSVDAPTPADPFKEITVTLNGSGFQEPVDPAQGKIVVDNLIPLVTVGGNATVTSVRILNSSPTSLQAKIFFSALVQDVTVELTLRSLNECVPLGIVLPFKKTVRVKSTNIKNYVESITFPNGNAFDKNSIGTIYINLLFPAPGGGASSGASLGTISTGPLKRPPGGIVYNPDVIQNLYVNALTNSRVFFKFVPANAFVGVPNGTPINATGFNEVRANAGEDIIPITFKVADCLGGQPGQLNSVKIQTWMHTTNTNLPPSFVEQTFSVRCTQ